MFFHFLFNSSSFHIITIFSQNKRSLDCAREAKIYGKICNFIGSKLRAWKVSNAGILSHQVKITWLVCIYQNVGGFREGGEGGGRATRSWNGSGVKKKGKGNSVKVLVEKATFAKKFHVNGKVPVSVLVLKSFFLPGYIYLHKSKLLA